jgi:hypothetical protein
LNKWLALKGSHHERSRQRRNQFERLWNVRWERELSGLSGNPRVPACRNWAGLVHTSALPFATAVCCPEINLILRMISQPLQAPARTHSPCNPRRPSASSKIEKSACDQSSPPHPSRGACGHLRVAELERPSLCRIETPRRRLCRAHSGSACDPATGAP